ncbi:MAG: monomeric [FeFe] hydrogenase [Planctomycetia bacterium]|jgi:[FeFe] hydrogenase (group B1/B3)
MAKSYYPNEASRLRRDVLRRVARWHYAGMDLEQIDRLPSEIIPRGKPRYRCCIYAEREIVKHRIIAAFGFSVEAIEDEFRPLSSYAVEALQRTSPPETPQLTVLDMACDNCVRTEYSITDACHGCLARPCVVNCPKDCISIQGRRAVIDNDQCINCGKCQKVCPYHAVIKMVIPCEEACPVGAIYRDAEGNQRIAEGKCISCGRCLRACPFGAIMDKSQMIDVLQVLCSERSVVAMCAPSIVGQFDDDWRKVVSALKAVGFTRVVEVASGADQTCREEAAEFEHRVVEQGQEFMTTSCCPAYIEAVDKHLPELAPFVSKTPTPMHMTAQAIRKSMPEAVTVFLGPCVAKRHEGLSDPMVDYVLTFEEVGAMFAAADVEVSSMEMDPIEEVAGPEGRGFAVTGGPSGAICSILGKKECDREATVQPVVVDGLSLQGVKQLRAFATRGTCPGNLVEVVACEGGCVGGPAVYNNPRKTTAAVKRFADASSNEPR